MSQKQVPADQVQELMSLIPNLAPETASPDLVTHMKSWDESSTLTLCGVEYRDPFIIEDETPLLCYPCLENSITYPNIS